MARVRVLTVCALLVIGVFVFWRTHTKAPTVRDEFFYNVAFHFRAPDVCDKINRFAEGRGDGWEEPGYQTSYMRSNCYFDLAGALHDSQLCDHVRPFNTLFEDGSKWNPIDCRLLRDDKPLGPVPQAREQFVQTMKSLGYSIDTGQRSQLGAFGAYWDFFLRLAKEDANAPERQEFLRKVRAME